MMTTETREMKDRGKCVQSCMTATVRECDCACGGRNHGIQLTERLDQFEEVHPLATVPPDTVRLPMIARFDLYPASLHSAATSKTQLVMGGHDRPAWMASE